MENKGSSVPYKQCLIALNLLLAGVACAQDHPGADAFVSRATSEHGLDPEQVAALLAGAEFKQSIVDAISRPAEGKPWHQYRPIFLTDKRIAEGVEFWNENAELLAQVAEKYQVDPQVVVAIIGVETFYGRITGSYRVLDALATLPTASSTERHRSRAPSPSTSTA